MRHRACWAALLALPITLSACGDTPAAQPGPSAASTPSAASAAPAAVRTGPLPDSATASCAFAYAPEAVRERAFAFDGTVTGVGKGRSNKPGTGALDLSGVTFQVHEWWRGGGPEEVTVDLPPPGTSGQVDDEEPPAYDVGTRLLVSGEPRWGWDPLQDPIGWGCGFTRYHDEQTAEQWRQALT